MLASEHEEAVKVAASKLADAVDRDIMKRIIEEVGGDMGFAEDVLDELKTNPCAAVPIVKGEPIHLLVDGDLVAYRSAAATEGVCYLVDGPGMKHSETHKYHADAMKVATPYAEEAGIDPKTYLVKESKPEPASHAVNNLAKIMNKAVTDVMKQTGRPVDISVYLTSDSLFRDDVSPTYKKSREGQPRPTNLKACKKYLEDKWNAETITGYEADDLIAIQHTLNCGKGTIIMSLDKDLRQLAGQHYDWTKDNLYEVSDAQARENFWTQTLVGDSTDDIQGLYGVGPVTAKKLLKDCFGRSHYCYYKTVVKAYVKHLPKDEEESEKAYYSRILKQLGKACRLLWLCRAPEELWDVPLPSPKDLEEEAKEEADD